jgi:flagellar biosynthesis/type III secretory pathway M-ring protein FliF/YscJ
VRFLFRLLLIFLVILFFLRLVARWFGGTGRKQVGDWQSRSKPPESPPPSEDIRDAKFKDISE